MHETLQVMSALFALLQPHLARPELRPLAAQMLRCAVGGGGGGACQGCGFVWL